MSNNCIYHDQKIKHTRIQIQVKIHMQTLHTYSFNHFKFITLNRTYTIKKTE